VDLDVDVDLDLDLDLDRRCSRRRTAGAERAAARPWIAAWIPGSGVLAGRSARLAETGPFPGAKVVISWHKPC
jgi:hypothetical protein